MPKLKVNINNKNPGNKQEIIGTNFYHTNTEATNYTNIKNKISYANDNVIYKDDSPLDELDENVKEILYDQDKYDEEKGKLLYDKLKTRYNSFDMTKSKTKDKKKRKNWSKIKKRNIPSDYQLIATPQQISEFDYNLGQVFIKGNFRFLTNKQKEKLGYIGELNLFNSINRIKEKQNMIKEMKSEKKNGKNTLLPIDVFKYDADKWKKYTDEKNKNNNDVIINELNEKNKIKLDDMKGYIDKLNSDANSYDKDVTNIINNIDNFLDKYGADNNITVTGTRKNSKASEYSIKNIEHKKTIKTSRIKEQK